MKIYAITCLECIEEKNTWPYFGASSFMGYYTDKDTAINAVKENRCDIAERCYNYAVVEEISEGLYAYPRPRWFFKYDADKDIYFSVAEPEFMKYIANIL